VARLAGDEFAVLLPTATPDEARAAAAGILEAVRRRVVLEVEETRVQATASVGVCVVEPHREMTAEELLAEADLAMYDAKETGRDRIGMASAETVDERSLKARMHWLERIRRALDEESFIVYCQPIAEIASGSISQFELLLRMEDENGQVIPATAFLATAERFDLVQEIDRWMIRKAIRLIAEHSARGRDYRLEVNISAKSIGDEELTRLIERELAVTGIDPSLLILEITETTAIANMDEAVDFATRLSRLGCGFALDDFGTGFGSFYYLKHLPIDYVKIDGDFIRDLPDAPTDQLMVRAMVDVARGLGMRTVAEFVGDAATEELLRGYGIDYAQGYHVGRPAPVQAA
jgi:predicted signal transduction protein with EAL and GGDEF domain